MKLKAPLLIFLTLLTSCSNTNLVITDKVFCFDTMFEIKLYDGDKTDIEEIESTFNKLNQLTDNYQARSINNIYTINNTNESVTIDEGLYDLLKLSFDFQNNVSNYFNPLCGNLAKKWKESLKNLQILDEISINEELDKIKNTSVDLSNINSAQRIGEAEIDLGGVAKGYALDQVFQYLDNSDINHYLINGGRSSILLGEKKSSDGLFNVGLSDINNAYLKLKNCFVSTSGVSTQGVTINGITYSHIINPIDGSAVNKHDTVIVISSSGFLGDALSTTMMLCDIDEIKELENKCNVQTIVIDEGQIIYQNENVQIYKH